jgi:hypothetical protein
MNAFRTALGGLLLVITIAGCSGAAGPTVKPGENGSREPGPTTVPGDPGSGGGGQSGGSGGGVGGGGQVDPAPGGGDDGANLVVPKPGQLDPNPVFVTGLAVHIDGRQVSVRLTWWSGVEPCYVLDSVGVARDGRTIVLTAIEGHGPERVACIEIAQLKATIVDLGELEPGTYVIAAEPGDATPVTIEIT